MTRILDGKAIAERLQRSLRPRVSAVAAKLGRPPKLALVACAAEGSAKVFFERERKACAEAGIAAQELRVDPSGKEAALAARLKALSADGGVDGVLVEFPLPSGFDAGRVLEALEPAKDVEGLTAANAGRLYGAKSLAEVEAAGAFVPCTALAILRLAQASGRRLAGAQALVIGRSRVVGRPAAHLLSCADATVTLAHSRTRDLAGWVAGADLVVATAGKPGLVKGAMLKPGALVIDAGSTPSGGKPRGDVEGAKGKAGWLAPVPGGVGPVTVAELLNAVVTAAERRAESRKG